MCCGGQVREGDVGREEVSGLWRAGKRRGCRQRGKCLVRGNRWQMTKKALDGQSSLSLKVFLFVPSLACRRRFPQ